jgi:choline dehydrogenase-like flavoprotein
MQIIRNRTQYDVCVIGSGAGGGMAAMVLTQAGANVVMLEAGPFWDATLDTAMYKWPYQTPRRGAATPERHFGEFDAALGGWSLDGEPYTSAPGSQFDWFRSRMLGGRTNHWGRISLRFGPDDFRRKSIDGLGDDWPITYDDVKPYYDKIDRFIGIFGANLPEFPNEPDGIFLPPPTPRCYELLIQRASKKLNVPSVPSRLSILTRPHNGRAACHYCSQCGRGCSTHSNFSSPSVLIPPAMKTGRLKILYNAMAREVTVDNAGLASGVTYVDKTTAREVDEVPPGARQLERQRRQVPDGLDRRQRARVHPGVDGRDAAQRGRHRRHALVHAVVGRQSQAGLPPRLSYRAERRTADAECRLRRRRPHLRHQRSERPPGGVRRLRRAVEE